MNRYLIILLLITFLSCKESPKAASHEQPSVATSENSNIDYLEESEVDFDNRMEWWREARFGMFIHWGAYAVPAGIYKGKETKNVGEWIMKTESIPISEYEKFATSFNPVEFNASQWVSALKDAGMKYMVITSKHHDGFGLWDSEISDYDIMDASVYKKDILKALSDACKKEDIKFGLYYSTMDWHHPDAQADTYAKGGTKDENNEERFNMYYENYMKPQLKELITKYDPAILWFDGEWTPEFTHEQGLDLYQYVRSLKPSILINNRVDKGRKGMQGMNDGKMKYAGDFGTPEQEILDGTSTLDWESCMTMNDTWGYKTNDHNWKTSETLIFNLVDAASKGGNYLLNVGPDAKGVIPEASIKRLKDIGDWLDINGEAVYNTESVGENYKQGDVIRIMKKKNASTLYATSFKKPEETFTLDAIHPEDGSNIYILGIKENLDWSYKDEKLMISVPLKALNELGEKYAWTFKIENGKTK
ncbi:alpha-L-fucosidase [Joostella sp.]|uniref:alpha-L-fucosidase n=1 Tax=Joostella sp. TaxID=2231138 RepID=UPI003A935CB3